MADATVDAVGTRAVVTTVANTPATAAGPSITAGAGVLMFVSTNSGTTNVLSSPMIGGVAATELGTGIKHNNGIFGITHIYYVPGSAGLPAGPAALSITPSLAGQKLVINGVSVLNFDSISQADTKFGSSTAPASNAITVAAGQLALCVMGFSGTNSIFNSTSGGTEEDRYPPTATVPGQAIVASTASTTFGGALSASTLWGSMTALISPPAASGTTVQPGGATITATPGTPTVTAPMVVTPGGASIVATGGTANLGGDSDVVVAPGPAEITATGGTPWVVQGQLNAFMGNLFADVDAGLLFIGDSTIAGVGDETLTFGWPSIFGIAIGMHFDYNVVLRRFSGTWTSASTIHTAARGVSAPTLTILNGGVGGTTLNNQETYLSGNLLQYVSLAQAAIAGTGFNDEGIDGDTPSEFVANYQTFETNFHNAAPGFPLVITTENHAVASTYDANFSALAAWLTGSGIPSNPVYWPETTVADVGFIDSRQAWDPATNPGYINADGVHPKRAGYIAYANFMLAQLTGGVVAPVYITPGAATITAVAGTPSVDIASVTTVIPGGATIIATPGTPAVTAPMVVAPAGADIDAIGGIPWLDVNSGDIVIVPGNAVITATGGTPVVSTSTPIEMLEQQAVSAEQFFIAWLKPLGRATIRVNDDTPLPVRRVQQIWGVDDPNAFYTTARVKVHTMCYYSADGDDWELAAEAEAQRTHDRILYLILHDVSVTLPDGRVAAVDYLEVIQVPVWIDYENDQILDKEAEYEIGLTFTPAAT